MCQILRRGSSQNQILLQQGELLKKKSYWWAHQKAVARTFPFFFFRFSSNNDKFGWHLDMFWNIILPMTKYGFCGCATRSPTLLPLVKKIKWIVQVTQLLWSATDLLSLSALLEKRLVYDLRPRANTRKCFDTYRYCTSFVCNFMALNWKYTIDTITVTAPLKP